VLSLKSLNHRGLDVRFHMDPELDPHENAMRSLISRRVARGHLDVRLLFARNASPGAPAWNRPLLEAYLAAFREVSREYGLGADPDLNSAFRIPGMFADTLKPELPPNLEELLLSALDEALNALNAYREREGGELAAELRSRCENIRQAAQEMEALRSRILPQFHARLAERLSELLGGAPVEPQRLAQEAALLADRSDIVEELDRLKIHSSRLAELLEEGGEVGKRLDFLLQEMQRETNTILSKTSGVAGLGISVTELALRAKANIEKIREQALNLE